MQHTIGSLLWQVGSVMEKQSDAIVFNELGIGYAQFKILHLLLYSDGKPQNYIAHELGQSEASISRQIKLLKQAGFIELHRPENNKKEHVISLSDKGAQAAEDALAVLNRYHAPILAVLDESQQSQLHALLSLIKTRL